MFIPAEIPPVVSALALLAVGAWLRGCKIVVSELANQVDLGGGIVIKALCEARFEREVARS